MRTATFVAAAAALAGSAAAVDCVKGLHMIVGRGTGEPKGLGETGALAKNISEKIPNSDYVAVDYPASLDNPGYEKSEMMGAKDVYNQVTEYHKACPGGKMAYLGWSQVRGNMEAEELDGAWQLTCWIGCANRSQRLLRRPRRHLWQRQRHSRRCCQGW